MASSSSRIEVFARVRPSRTASGLLSIEEKKVIFDTPKDERSGYVNHQREHHDFRFDGIFGADSLQEEVFDGVAKKVIDKYVDCGG
jgi:kinesin family protein 6/9